MSEMYRRLVAIAIVCSSAFGCGSGEPFGYRPVSGAVKFEDGAPIANVDVVFQPIDVAPVGDAHPVPGTARTNDEGVFENVTSHKYGDGLAPGTYKVAVGAGDAIPKAYRELFDSPLTVTTDELPMEIKIPRP